MPDATYVAALVSAEQAAKLTEGMSEGEQSAVTLICLTENLVDTVTDIVTRAGAASLATVFENMIRQLGVAAVTGCKEHYQLSDDQITGCVDAAGKVTQTIMDAAHEAAIKRELENSNADAKH